METKVEEIIEAADEQDVAAFACSSTERERLVEFFKYLDDGLDYSTLASCRAEIYLEMFGDHSDIQDMIIKLGEPDTCLAEVHEEVQWMHQGGRKLVASDTSRKLGVGQATAIIGAIAELGGLAETSYTIGSGTYEQDVAVSFAHR
jgi:hypothetical protein